MVPLGAPRLVAVEVDVAAGMAAGRCKRANRISIALCYPCLLLLISKFLLLRFLFNNDSKFL